MNYGRIFSDYKEELELALIQNCAVECELYSIVASVFANPESGRKVSIPGRFRKTNSTTESSYLKGESWISRFCGAETGEIKHAPILGCVEIKRPDVKLTYTDQLDGHVLSYRKVIYTNGLVWQFFEPGKKMEEICLGSYTEQDIQWGDASHWFQLLKKINSFQW